MDTPVLVSMIIVFLGLGFLIFYLYQKRKYAWIAPVVFAEMGIFMLAMPTIFPSAAHGWDDLGYVLLGIFLILFSVALAIIIAIVLAIRKQKSQSQDN